MKNPSECLTLDDALKVSELNTGHQHKKFWGGSIVFSDTGSTVPPREQQENPVEFSQQAL
jgi:hypothetical protein